MTLRLISTEMPRTADGEELKRTPTLPLDSAETLSEEQSLEARAIARVPPECIGQKAALQEAAALRDQLAQERAAHRLLRANAEQARRVVGCLQAFHLLLLTNLQQPCFQLGRDGRITRWNPALEDWSGVTRTEAEGQPLSACLPLPTCALIEGAIGVALASEAEGETAPVLTLEGPLLVFSDQTAEELTLLPLYRIPHIIEAFVVLVSR